MLRMFHLVAVICLAASIALAAKYVDPFGGNDANDGSIAAPWKTLANIHGLNDTVYISNSAVCSFGTSANRNPVDVTLLPWGQGTPSIVLSNIGGANDRLILMGGTGRRFAMRDIKIIRAQDLARRFVHLQGGDGNTVDIRHCEFDLTGDAYNRMFYFRSSNSFLLFHSNLVYNLTTTEYLVHNESDNNKEHPFTIDARYNRFFWITGTGGGGIFFTRVTGCKGIIANNTAWGCTYLNSTERDVSGVTNVNNIVANFITNGNNNARWFCYSNAERVTFCDFTFSGDPENRTFGAGVIQGPSNLVNLSGTQLAFANTNDVGQGNFLKIDVSSVAARSDAAAVYPALGLPAYAGWSEPIPEPAVAVVAAAVFVWRRRR